MHTLTSPRRWIVRILAGAALVSALAAASACGGSTKADETGAQPPTQTPTEPAPAPVEPTPAQAAPISREECESQGGRVAGDIGDGKIQCNPGERELGRVTLGIEGGLCCAPGGG